MKRIFFLLFFFIFLPAGVFADFVFPEIDRPFLRHHPLVPYYSWNSPSCYGKLNVLVIAHSWTTPEFAEFCKRFNMEYDIVPIWSENFLSRSFQSPESKKNWQRIIGLLKEKRYDAILITSYGDFPAVVWESIYRASIESKTGLLFFNTGGPYSAMPKQMEKDRFISKEDRLTSLPLQAVSLGGLYEEVPKVGSDGGFAGFETKEFPFADRLIFSVNKNGSRVVLFDWQKSPYFYWSIHQGIVPAGFYFPYGRIFPAADHLFALVAKAVLWSAGKEPELFFSRIYPLDEKIPVEDAKSLTYSVTVSNNSLKKGTINIDWEILNEDEEVISSGRERGEVQGRDEAVFKLNGAHLSGKHLYLRARLLVRGRVADWATSHIEVVYPEDDWEFSVANGTLLRDDGFECHIKMPEGAGRDSVVISLFDSWSRRLVSVVCEGIKDERVINIPVRDVPGVSCRLQAKRFRDGREIGIKEHFCTMLRVPEQRYFGIRSESINSTVTGWYLGHINSLFGMDFFRTNSTPYFANTLFGFSSGVYSYYGRITGPISPEMEDTYNSFIEKDVVSVKPYGGYLYDFGDDTGVGAGLFRSKAKTKEEKDKEELKDLGRFIEYLRGIYKSSSKLSESWQVKLKLFSDVKREIITEEQNKNNLVPLLDYRQYQEYLYAKHLRHMRTILREKIPWARTTLNGYGNIGRNIEAVAGEVDSLVSYYRPHHLRELRGILGRDKSLGTVTGAYYREDTDKRFLSFIPWETVFLGGNVVWLWGSGCIAEDGGFSKSTEPIFQSTREIASGIGELLANAEWNNHGIYILSCPYSKHAQEMGPELGTVQNSSETFATLLEELQVGYDFISSSDVAEGRLISKKANVLFLPYSVGIDPAVQKKVREFVSNGGTVVADFRPGTRTPRGRPLSHGGLDDLFGVEQVESKVPVIYGKLPEIGIETMVDAATRVTTGKPLKTIETKPILIVNQYGQGKTLLLNSFVGRYRTLYSAGTSDALTEWLLPALKSVGIKTEPFGSLPAGTKVFRYDRGVIRYLAVYREDIPETPERMDINLSLNAPYYIYDVRKGIYLGNKNAIPLEIGIQEPHLYAVSPVSLSPFTAKIEGSSWWRMPGIKPGESLRISLSFPLLPEKRLLRMEVFLSDGRIYPGTPRLIWADGSTGIDWKTAFNDIPGRYKMVLCDVETGQKWSSYVKIKN